MAGATLRAVLGQPTTPLVVQHRSAIIFGGSVIVGTGGVAAMRPPLRLHADDR
jgi:hypothetical protein